MKVIMLTRGFQSTVDDADFESLSRCKWCALVTKKRNGNTCVYAVRAESKKMILMHRQILGLTVEKIKVDHKDVDSLNNQRENLRKATTSQNNCNGAKRRIRNVSSRFKGVTVLPAGNFRAIIRDGRKTRHIGVFGSEEEAASAYDREARKQWGEFARTNDMGGVPFYSDSN